MTSTKTKTKNLPWFYLNLGLAILLLSTLLGRLIVANVAASQHYASAKQQQALKIAADENSQLKLAATELQAIDRIKAESSLLNLVKVDQVYYLSANSAVAVNK